MIEHARKACQDSVVLGILAEQGDTLTGRYATRATSRDYEEGKRTLCDSGWWCAHHARFPLHDNLVSLLRTLYSSPVGLISLGDCNMCIYTEEAPILPGGNVCRAGRGSRVACLMARVLIARRHCGERETETGTWYIFLARAMGPNKAGKGIGPRLSSLPPTLSIYVL